MIEVTRGRGMKHKQLLNGHNKKIGDTLNWKRKHYIALCGE